MALRNWAPLTWAKKPSQVRNGPYTSAGPNDARIGICRYGTSPSTNAPPERTSSHGVRASSCRASKSTKSTTIGTTVIARPWFETHKPPMNAPRSEVPWAPRGAPDERAMEEQRDEQQVERVHLRERGFLPERPGERQREPGGGRDDRADPEPDHDQDGHPDHGRRGRRRQQVHPPCDRPGRDEREQLAEQDEQGVAGRVHDPEPVRVQLGVRPVAEADAREERPDVDEGRHRERRHRGEVARVRPRAEPFEQPGPRGQRRRCGDVQRGLQLRACVKSLGR